MCEFTLTSGLQLSLTQTAVTRTIKGAARSGVTKDELIYWKSLVLLRFKLRAFNQLTRNMS